MVHFREIPIILLLIYYSFITYGAKVLNSDWLRRTAFFSLLTRAPLIIKRARLLDADWLTNAYPEQAKSQENLLPDYDSDLTAFCPHIKYKALFLLTAKIY